MRQHVRWFSVSKLVVPGPLVSVSWLKEAAASRVSNLRIVDASWCGPGCCDAGCQLLRIDAVRGPCVVCHDLQAPADGEP
jgi:hypothetical protein